MATLYFTRKFTRGILSGVSHLDKITCDSPEMCIAWADSINARERRGKIAYRIADRAFQNYCRN